MKKFVKSISQKISRNQFHGKNYYFSQADEPKNLCDLNECSEGTEVGGGCDQQCIDLPIGYKCACKQGYQLIGNTTCIGMPRDLIYMIGCSAEQEKNILKYSYLGL